MGEAKRRQDKPRGRLPDFIFGRDRKAEKDGGFILAGTLVTDIPKEDAARRDAESPALAKATRTLLDALRDHPDLHEAGLWRDGVKPPDGLAPPFPAAMVAERVNHCVIVTVRIDKGERPRLFEAALPVCPHCGGPTRLKTGSAAELQAAGAMLTKARPGTMVDVFGCDRCDEIVDVRVRDAPLN